MLQRTSLAMLIASVLAMTSQLAAAADPPSPVPKRESAQRACDTSKGQTKEECKKVAAEIDQTTANPAAHPEASNPSSSSQDVHHSGPAMRTPEEKRQDAAASKKERIKQDEAAADKTPPK